MLIITSTAAGATVGVSDQLVWERVLDTLIGAVVGAVSGIVHPQADKHRRR